MCLCKEFEWNIAIHFYYIIVTFAWFTGNGVVSSFVYTTIQLVIIRLWNFGLCIFIYVYVAMLCVECMSVHHWMCLSVRGST